MRNPNDQSMEEIHNHSRRNWSKRNLPSEFWGEILTFLPAKSLLRFRTICKTWKSLIKRCPSNFHQSHLIVSEMPSRGNNIQWVLRRCHDLRKSQDFESPVGNGISEWRIVDASDGLILLRNYSGWKREDDIILWHPSMRKSLNIPPPPSLPLPDFESILSGFNDFVPRI